MGGGRSNLVLSDGASVLKIYDPKRSNPLFENDPQREACVLGALVATDLAPQLLRVGQTEGLDWLSYVHLDGTLWKQNVADVAELLGRVHLQPAPGFLPKGPDGSVDIAAQVRRILGLCLKNHGLLDAEPAGVVPPSGHVSLVHGDPVPANIVVSNGRLRLIDWQCPTRGDPAEDLAIFLSPAMQYLYRGAVLTDAEEQEFLNSYPRKSVVSRYLQLRPWFHWRMAAYCAWRMQRGDPSDGHAMVLEIERLKSFNP